MIVKDRVARGDNKYLMKQLNDGTGRIELTPSPDEVIEEGTVLNKSVLQPLFDGLDKIATVETVVNQGKQEIQSATNEAVERLSNAQPESNPKIYTTTELSDPQENKIYNVKIEENTSAINEKPVYKENTSESVTLKAGKVATVYYQGGNFFYKASASGDAVAENVLAGKKFSNDDDTDITGTMPNHGGKIFKPSTANIIIQKGFHNGTGYIEGDPDLVAGNIVQGKQIFGVDGSAEIITPSQKAGIANAITSKGIPTSTSASLVTMQYNILQIGIGNYTNLTGSMFTHTGSERAYHNLIHHRGFIVLSSRFYVLTSISNGVLTHLVGDRDIVYPMLYRINRSGRFYISVSNYLGNNDVIGFIIY